ncbi:hypothetical protein B0G84_1977 [Paraburkholderia sp. BL8N3]|jgi:hypothetical protein|nr:DUF1109 domain-containing protein [Paraburkholderia sp. BL8N3]TCK43635.1 hypothetical protein B0G84_1977 [Paraburkholderia sp. BL8N3]
MKTDDLVSMLATGAAPVERHVAAKRFGWALVLGALGALAVVVTGYGVRSDIAMLLHVPLFWAKVAWPACVAIAALATVARLGRPGKPVGGWWLGLATPLALVWLAALLLLWLAPPGMREHLLLGRTWRSCSFNIALISLPALAAALWAVRGLAPTRLRLTGAIAGLMAGTIGALTYCLRCPEMSVPFWATWYLIGMSIPTAAGALLGPRVLRW